MEKPDLRTWNNRLINYREESCSLLLRWDNFSNKLICKEENGLVKIDTELDNLLSELISDTNDLLTADEIKKEIEDGE